MNPPEHLLAVLMVRVTRDEGSVFTDAGNNGANDDKIPALCYAMRFATPPCVIVSHRLITISWEHWPGYQGTILGIVCPGDFGQDTLHLTQDT